MKDYSISHLAYAAAIEHGGKVWVSNWRFNGLFSIKDGVVKYEGRFKGYPNTFVACHSLARSHDDVLYFFPQKSNIVDIYHIKDKEFSKIIIKEWEKFQTNVIAGIVECENGFWLFSRYAGIPAVRMNYEGDIVETYSLKCLKQLEKVSNEEVFTISICNISDKDVYIPVFNSNVVLYVNLKTKEEKLISINEASKIYAMEYDGSNFWISDGRHLLCCGEKLNRISVYKNVIDIPKNNQHRAEVAKIVCMSDTIYIIPVWYGRIGKLNKKNNKFKLLDISDNECNVIKDRIRHWRTFKEAVSDGERLMIYPISLECQIEIYEEKIQYTKYIVPNDSIPLLDLSEKAILNEMSIDDLEFFLNACKSSNLPEEERKGVISIGERIFRKYICPT